MPFTWGNIWNVLPWYSHIHHAISAHTFLDARASVQYTPLHGYTCMIVCVAHVTYVHSHASHTVLPMPCTRAHHVYTQSTAIVAAITAIVALALGNRYSQNKRRLKRKTIIRNLCIHKFFIALISLYYFSSVRAPAGPCNDFLGPRSHHTLRVFPT